MEFPSFGSLKKGQGAGIAVIIVVVIIIVVVLALYGGWVPLGDKEKAFRGGEEAFVLSFINLPSQVNQEQEFNIEVLVQNKGEYAIPAGHIRAVLNNAQTFNIQSLVQTNPQIVRSVEDGGETEFIYPNAKYVATVLSEEIPQTLSVGICYPYQTTVLVRDVCLAPSGTNALCEYMGEKEVENSGAPVHLTFFKQLSSVYNTGEEYVDLAIKLEFEKKGSGEVYSPDAKCASISTLDANKIKISSMKVGTESIDIIQSCGTGTVVFSEKEGKTEGSLRCTIRKKGIKTDAMSVLTMTLDYLFEQQLKGSITVMPS